LNVGLLRDSRTSKKQRRGNPFLHGSRIICKDGRALHALWHLPVVKRQTKSVWLPIQSVDRVFALTLTVNSEAVSLRPGG